ncbi:MAG: type II toxin-antitoxin system HipA family toxin [Alphaproteobacteria bacterium]|nr:type II toxin-antitoxin system HipA family toxin [Alphaproteobacteria bacterium]
MSEIEVHISLEGETERVGTLFRQASRGRESVTFEYHPDWQASGRRFSLEPGLAVSAGMFHPGAGREMFGSIGDSAPDTWGRRLMQRAERRQAQAEDRPPRTLHEADFLLGVSDISRLGALRFKKPDDTAFQKPLGEGVPGFVQLGRLLDSARRIERDEETDEDLSLIFAPGSSLGGARPKASIMDAHGNLAIAKFPKDSDDYSIETWEHIALTLAKRAGIRVPVHELHHVGEKPVLVSWRFDREDERRVPFLSAMAMLQAKDGERSSYPEIVDELTQHGARAGEDSSELFRRMIFNILISNVDDHLRNHGFLWAGRDGWVLSPAYDLNPTPTDLKARILTTNISLDEGTCSIDLAMAQADLFGLSTKDAAKIVSETGKAVAQWRTVAAQLGQSKTQIDRMASAFEHDDLVFACRKN